MQFYADVVHKLFTILQLLNIRLINLIITKFINIILGHTYMGLEVQVGVMVGNKQDEEMCR